MLYVYLPSPVSALRELCLVRRGVLLLQYSHLLNLVEIDHEALVHVVEVLDALAAED